MKVELVSKTEGVGKYEGLTSEEIVSAIARHGIIKEDNGKLVKYLMTNAHWSPLDMINFTFEIETSRAIGRQILRHASIRFQEHSQRYSDRVQFEPIELRKEDKVNRQSSTEPFDPLMDVVLEVDTNVFAPVPVSASAIIADHLHMVEKLYKDLLEVGVAKECARNILPECTTSTLSANGTIRSWLAFLNVRLDGHAQLECQLIAKEIGEALEREMPNVFANIDWRNGMFM
jgi:thymidylate synthase (FAD)